MEELSLALNGLFETTTTPVAVIAARLILAAVLGAILGLEREWQAKPAGLRTHMVTALAAATFAVLTLEIVALYEGAGDNVRSDPIRLIDSITAGVAFLAAGVILHARGRVEGLTTGAGMWLSGAIGAAAGLGYGIIAMLGAGIGLFIILALRIVSAKVPGDEGDGDSRAGGEEKREA
ncbi:MgtC/SapB family protein [Afifella sp. YEN Y35]|uniref:MgtC/SapB family protein n=1 Tax=Afifella sp. YEN Y35 TaxID=3388337 RepID=UPI0039DF9FBF